MKKIFDKYDKTQLANLPRVLFSGHIEIIVNESDAEKAVKFLMNQPLLGFDTETRPSFKVGRQYQVALLQVCSLTPYTSSKGVVSDSVCFLFRLNHIGLPQCLIKLLEDTQITKVGLSWQDDLRSLLQRKQFKAGSFIDLQNISKEMGIQDMSLQKLYANIFGERICKGQRLSNWEADNLTEAQKLYAATDAWACVKLYKEMKRMQKDGFELEIVKDEEDSTSQR